MTLPSRRQRLVRGSARLGSQRGSWLIIQRKWTKERERDGGSHSAAIRRAERKREQGKNGEVAERGGREGEIDRKRIGGKGRERRGREGEGEKDSPHKHLECDTMVSSAHIKALVQGA